MNEKGIIELRNAWQNLTSSVAGIGRQECEFMHGYILGCLHEWGEAHAEAEKRVKFTGEKIEQPTHKIALPEHFRVDVTCLQCTGGLCGVEMDCHNTVADIDTYLSGHKKAFGHTKYTLELKYDNRPNLQRPGK
jgi:hypothetical protein